MAHVAGVPTLIFHLSAAEAVRELQAARARRQIAYGEACLPYLLLDPSAYDEPLSGPALPFSPPLRDSSIGMRSGTPLGAERSTSSRPITARGAVSSATTASC